MMGEGALRSVQYRRELLRCHQGVEAPRLRAWSREAPPRPPHSESTWPPRRGRGGSKSGQERGGAAVGGASAQAQPARSPGWRSCGPGPVFEVETGGCWGPGASVGALEFLGEGSCQTEAEGHKAEAAENLGAPPLRHCGFRVPPLPLQPPALPCLPGLQSGQAISASSELASGPWPLWGE